ncbi:MAG: hypothetical protein ABIV51_02315, partial [Saprospiraceae bacterium]
MKRFFSVGVTALVAVFVLGFSSCVKDTCTEKRTFTRVDPVYVQAEDFRIPLEVVAPQALVDPGIVYAYGSYLLINEKRKGVHVIDNTNPASPVPISFIKIPGNVDFAVRDGYLYADSYLDLLTIDIRQANAPIFVSRKEDVFKPLWADQNFGYCVYYKVTAETTVLDCADNNFNQPIFWTGGGVWANAEFIDKADNSGASGNGVGGSFAKFTLSGSRLYMVDQYSLNTYNVDNASSPVFVSTLQLGWGIETIFPVDGNLFVGSTNGVHILSITNPDQPKYLSKFDHASSCDPVYVVGNTAYVTLRSGTRCQGFT